MSLLKICGAAIFYTYKGISRSRWNSCIYDRHTRDVYYYKGYKKIENNDLPNDNFSPESGGSVKPKTAIDAIRTHGTIKLKK